MTTIPFIDLQAQYRRLKPAIDTRIQRVLAHGQFILGPEVRELEERLAAVSGASHVVAVSSGTDALFLTLLAEGVGPGDAVFVPAFTFAATAEVVLRLGAEPVFVDSEPDTFNMSVRDLGACIARVEAERRLRPGAIIAVDLFGQPADYPALQQVADRHGAALIADAAQSFGASLHGRKVGALAAVSATSFYPSKPLGCYGDGGAIFAMASERADMFRALRAHGRAETGRGTPCVGLNARLDTMQAAVLLAKLDAFEEELAARERIATRYDAALREVAEPPARAPGVVSAWAQYSVLVDARDAIVERLRAAEIPIAIHYAVPIHLRPDYAGYSRGPGSLPVAERLSARIMSLPMHPDLDAATQDRICAALVSAAAMRRP